MLDIPIPSQNTPGPLSEATTASPNASDLTDDTRRTAATVSNEISLLDNGWYRNKTVTTEAFKNNLN